MPGVSGDVISGSTDLLTTAGAPGSRQLIGRGVEVEQAEKMLAAERPFVGRGQELTVVRNGLAAAAAGEGVVVVVAGPAGIGKSRLVEEVLRPDAPRGGQGRRVGRGYCAPGRAAPSLWPWQQALRAIVRHRGADTAAAAAALQALHSVVQRDEPDNYRVAAATRAQLLSPPPKLSCARPRTRWWSCWRICTGPTRTP